MHVLSCFRDAKGVSAITLGAMVMCGSAGSAAAVNPVLLQQAIFAPKITDTIAWVVALANKRDVPL